MLVYLLYVTSILEVEVDDLIWFHLFIPAIDRLVAGAVLKLLPIKYIIALLCVDLL